MNITPYEIAMRFTGIKEVDGPMSNPQILSMLRLDDKWPKDDSVPWCSAFVNYVCWLLRLPRSKSLRARSWLEIGIPTNLSGAITGFEVVILQRGGMNQPGPEVIDAPGHVGFLSGLETNGYGFVDDVLVLGGNQSNTVNISRYKADRVLGVRLLKL